MSLFCCDIEDATEDAVSNPRRRFGQTSSRVKRALLHPRARIQSRTRPITATKDDFKRGTIDLSGGKDVPDEIVFSSTRSDTRTEDEFVSDDQQASGDEEEGAGDASNDDISELTMNGPKKQAKPPKEILYDLGADFGTSPLKKKNIFMDFRTYRKRDDASFSA